MLRWACLCKFEFQIPFRSVAKNAVVPLGPAVPTSVYFAGLHPVAFGSSQMVKIFRSYFGALHLCLRSVLLVQTACTCARTGFECLILPDMSLLLFQSGSSAFAVGFFRHVYSLTYDPRAAAEVVRMTHAYGTCRRAAWAGVGCSTYTPQLIESVFATPSLQAGSY